MYVLRLQGNLVRLQVTSPKLSSSSNVDELLKTYYDDDNAVILPYGVRAYEHKADALRAFVRAYERRKACVSKHARGMIKEFSKRSRHRLLSLAARLDESAKGVLVTFTYRSNMQDYDLSKKHLEYVLRYFKYHYPHAAALWRMETQRRGAIHYHVMLLTNTNVWVDVNGLRAYWRSLVGEIANIDVKWIDNRKRAMNYVSKYVAKMDEEEASGAADGSLDNVPYSEKDASLQIETAAVEQSVCELASIQTIEAAESSAFVGRFWGVFNRRLLPLAAEHVFSFSDKFTFEYVELTRAVKAWAKAQHRLALCKGKLVRSRFYKWLRNTVTKSHNRAGFTLFTDAEQWLRWCTRYIGVCVT